MRSWPRWRRMKRGATRACSTAHHPGPSEHILGPSSRATDTSRSLFRAAYRAIDRGPPHTPSGTVWASSSCCSSMVSSMATSKGTACWPGCRLRWLQRFGRVSAAAWFVCSFARYTRENQNGVGCAAISAVFGAISIGFPRRLWTLSTVFSALAVLGYES